METILFNRYLTAYLSSFLDIPSTIHVIQTSHIHYDTITAMSKYKSLQNCKPKYTINNICNYGNTDVLDWFLMTHQKNLDIILMVSAISGNLDIVKHMIAQEADIRAYNMTLQYSARYGHLEVVQQLFLQSKNNCSTRRQYLLCKY
jgi:hypothetical protein